MQDYESRPCLAQLLGHAVSPGRHTPMTVLGAV